MKNLIFSLLLLGSITQNSFASLICATDNWGREEKVSLEVLDTQKRNEYVVKVKLVDQGSQFMYLTYGRVDPKIVNLSTNDLIDGLSLATLKGNSVFDGMFAQVIFNYPDYGINELSMTCVLSN